MSRVGALCGLPRRGGAHVPLQAGDVDEGNEGDVAPLTPRGTGVHAVGVREAVALVRVRACVSVRGWVWVKVWVRVS